MHKSQSICKKLFLFIVYVALTIYIISFFSLNFRNDEGFTMALVHHSFLNLIRIDSYDVHPPLYYLMLKLFLGITTFWTNSIFVKIIFARLFSFISFCLSFWLLTKIFKISQYKIKKQFLFIFVLLFPSVLFFATQIRMYSFGALLLILGIYLYQKLYKYYSFSLIVLFFICMLAASYVHYYYALFAGLFIFSLCILYSLNKKYKRALTFFGLDILLCIFYLPWVLYTFNNALGAKHTSNFALKKIAVQIFKIILIPTGILNSSLNGLHIISKVIIIVLIYIILILGLLLMMRKLTINNKRLFNINLIIIFILVLLGAISDLFGYEFSVSFLYPSFLIMIFVLLLSLLTSNMKFVKLMLVILSFLVIIMSLSCNIKNYRTSIIQFGKYERYEHLNRDVYVNTSNKLSMPNKLNIQMLRTHKMFRNVDDATLLLYMNKNMVINHKLHINKVGYKLWNNIKIKNYK